MAGCICYGNPQSPVRHKSHGRVLAVFQGTYILYTSSLDRTAPQHTYSSYTSLGGICLYIRSHSGHEIYHREYIRYDCRWWHPINTTTTYDNYDNDYNDNYDNNNDNDDHGDDNDNNNTNNDNNHRLHIYQCLIILRLLIHMDSLTSCVCMCA